MIKLKRCKDASQERRLTLHTNHTVGVGFVYSAKSCSNSDKAESVLHLGDCNCALAGGKRELRLGSIACASGDVGLCGTAALLGWPLQ